MNHKYLVAAIAACAALLAAPTFAAEEKKKETPKDIVLKGDARCTECHDENDSPKALAIGKTKHGVTADKRAPTCASCHGESDEHVKKAGRGTEKAPSVEVNFGKKTKNTAEERNKACLTCHQGANRISWQSSAHATKDVACTSCHNIHTANDKVRNKETQTDVCYTCPKEQRAQMSRPSHHPVPEGKMSCSDCHNVHGSAGPKLAKRDSTNATCYSCHAEKRGPFVHQHEPVLDDCMNCHAAHGSMVQALLKARPPMLCQQCHTPHVAGGVGALGGQPGVRTPASPAQSAQVTALSGGKNTVNIWQGRSCMNCHTQIHGSNNPSATNPTPQFMLR